MCYKNWCQSTSAMRQSHLQLVQILNTGNLAPVLTFTLNNLGMQFIIPVKNHMLHISTTLIISLIILNLLKVLIT